MVLLPVQLIHVCASGQMVSLFLVLYVNDIVITSEGVVAVEDTTGMLMGQFSMTDLGSVNVFVAMQVVPEPSKRRISILQDNYIASILERFAM